MRPSRAVDAARLRGRARPTPPRCSTASATRPPGAGRPRRGRGAGLPRGHRARGRPDRRGGPDRRATTGSARRSVRRARPGACRRRYCVPRRHPRRLGPRGLCARRASAAVRLGGRSRAHGRRATRSRWPTRSRPTRGSCGRACTPGLLRTVARDQAAGAEPSRSSRRARVPARRTPWRSDRRWRVPLCGPREPGLVRRPPGVRRARRQGRLEALMDELAIADWWRSVSRSTAPFHPGRSAAVLVGGSAPASGRAAPPRSRPAWSSRAGWRSPSSRCAALLAATAKEFVFRDVPRFPPVRRDLAFVVRRGRRRRVAVQRALRGRRRRAAGDLRAVRRVPRGPLPEGTKSLAFTLEFRAPDRTLTGEETDPLVDRIVAALARDFGAQLRAG